MARIEVLQVTGMTCVSCEKLVKDVLMDVQGVNQAEVSVKRGRAVVHLNEQARPLDLDLLNRQLEAHGYKLYPERCTVPTAREPFGRRLWRAVLAVVGVGLALLVLSPLRSVAPSVSVGASFGALFFLGFVASISSCLATTGGFMLAYSAEAASRRKTVLMHLGRLVAFVVGGALLGSLGGVLPQGSIIWGGVLALVLGIGFLGVALSLMDVSPSLAKWGIHLPSSLHTFAEKIRHRPGSITPFLVGAVTFILPCGFTQTAQALALASGSASSGAWMLFAFALGTLPVLIGVTAFASAATLRHRALRLIIGAVLFFFALNQVEAGLSVLGIAAPSFSASPTPAVVQAVGPMNQLQTVDMTVTSGSFVPNVLTVRKGIPVRWRVHAQDASGCTSSIASRELGIAKQLALGENDFTFTPSRTGTIAFSCGMGMVRGSFKVIE